MKLDKKDKLSMFLLLITILIHTIFAPFVEKKSYSTCLFNISGIFILFIYIEKIILDFKYFILKKKKIVLGFSLLNILTSKIFYTLKIYNHPKIDFFNENFTFCVPNFMNFVFIKPFVISLIFHHYFHQRIKYENSILNSIRQKRHADLFVLLCYILINSSVFSAFQTLHYHESFLDYFFFLHQGIISCVIVDMSGSFAASFLINSINSMRIFQMYF